jgi:hypothetical protein
MNTSCVSRAPTPTPIVQVVPPTIQKDTTPQVQKIVESNVKLQESVRVQKDTITKQTGVILDAMETAVDLQKQLEGTAPQIIATNLVAKLDDVKTRNMFMETTNADLQKQIDLQRRVADEAVALALMKDQESREWQSNNKTKDDIIQKVGVERDKAIQDREKFKGQAEKSGVYKFWVIMLASIFIGWTILKNVMMIYFPMIKFRV